MPGETTHSVQFIRTTYQRATIWSEAPGSEDARYHWYDVIGEIIIIICCLALIIGLFKCMKEILSDCTICQSYPRRETQQPPGSGSMEERDAGIDLPPRYSTSELENVFIPEADINATLWRENQEESNSISGDKLPTYSEVVREGLCYQNSCFGNDDGNDNNDVRISNEDEVSSPPPYQPPNIG